MHNHHGNGRIARMKLVDCHSEYKFYYIAHDFQPRAVRRTQRRKSGQVLQKSRSSSYGGRQRLTLVLSDPSAA